MSLSLLALLACGQTPESDQPIDINLVALDAFECGMKAL